MKYGTLTKPELSIDEIPSTEISNGEIPVTNIDNVHSKAEIVLDQETMVTTPVEGPEGNVVLTDDVDTDPVSDKNNQGA